MRDGPAYLVASLCLGWIAVWASENMFWTTPAPDLRVVELAVTWLVYSVAAGAALSAVIWSGLRGWRAAFLGGALVGFGIEGAVVGTMYDAFPLQLVWTPLAWHALISGLCVLGGGLALARGPVWGQGAGLAVLGLFGAVWGLYWPLEGKVLAGVPGLMAYLALTGLGAGVALGVLSRLPDMRWGRWWLWVPPGGMVAFWLVGWVLAPAPLRLLWPVMVGATVWAMGRLGAGGGNLFGPPVAWRRALALVLAPVVTALLVVPAWAQFGGVGVNVPIAWGSGLFGLGLWLWLLWRGVRG